MKKNEIIQIELDIIGTTEERPTLAAYAYDMQGKLLGQSLIKKDVAKLELEKSAQGQARIFIGPVVKDGRALSLTELKRIKAIERRVMLGTKEPLRFKIPESIFPYWIWCFCIIKGRVVVREDQPDGTVKELPICNSRVTICEVDPWPLIIRKLPDRELLKIRAELLQKPQLLPQESISKLKVATDARILRSVLASSLLSEWPRFLRWPWIYSRDCFTTVNTDENGYFISYYIYPCKGDKPDLCFTVEQQIDGVWKTVYKPRLPADVHWNYVCGSEIVVEVSDPAARPCYPEDTVDTAETTWIHPLAVGGMYIAGTAGVVPGGVTGWVRPNGRGSYVSSWINDIGGDVTDAPFGGTLGLRMNWSNDLPKPAVNFYRFSYRKKGSGDDWAHMTTPVSRHYVRTEPQGGGNPPIVSYPGISLGPVSKGGQQNLYEFRPHNPPLVEAGAPTGTTHTWPINLVTSGDLYAAFLPTAGLDDGNTYEIRIEAFSDAGAKVSPGGAFTFIVTTDLVDTTIHTRNAEPSEKTDEDFVFELYIDDRDCSAEIASPSTSQGNANNCGFLTYITNERVHYGWLADHPGDEARWRFKIVKGKTGAVVEIHGETGGSATLQTFPVTPTALDDISLSGGNYSGSIDIGALFGTCLDSAAFGESLYVWNKATNGWKRLGGSAHDQSDLEAFALTLAETS